MPSAESSQILVLLSSPDRRAILTTLSAERLRAGRLAEKLGLTPQETARQLERLEGAGLVERSPRSLYGLTGFAELALAMLPLSDFLGRHADFLRTHDLSRLPPALVSRLGELSEGEFGDGLGDVLALFEEIVDDSRQEVCLLGDQVLMRDLVAERVLGADEVRWRIVLPSAVARREGVDRIPAEFRGRLEVRLMEKVCAGLAMSELRAGVVFLDRAGRVDFHQGFRGAQPEFRRWCQDLFDWHWGQARPVP